MTTASISVTKNRLSTLLDPVRHGQRVLITDRGIPVAMLVQPDAAADADTDGRVQRLRRMGIIAGGSGRIKWSSVDDIAVAWHTRVEVFSAFARLHREGSIDDACLERHLAKLERMASAWFASEGRPDTLEFVCFDTRLASAAQREGLRMRS